MRAFSFSNCRRCVQPIRAAGRGTSPSGIPATLLASLVRSLLHALEEGSLREPFRKGLQRTPQGDAPTHVAAFPKLQRRAGPARRGEQVDGLCSARQGGSFMKNPAIARASRTIGLSIPAAHLCVGSLLQGAVCPPALWFGTAKRKASACLPTYLSKRLRPCFWA